MPMTTITYPTSQPKAQIMTTTALIVAKNQNSSTASGGRYKIPDDAWTLDALGRYAEFQHSLIHTAESYLTPTYWHLGQALELVHAKLTVRQFGQFLQKYGIHKVRASKARAIARFYPSPEELQGVSVQDAYGAAIKNHREQKPTQSEAADPKSESPAAATTAATPVTAALAALNFQLELLAKDLALNGIGPNEYALVASQLEKGIAIFQVMRSTIPG